MLLANEIYVDNARVKKRAGLPTIKLIIPNIEFDDYSDVYAYLDGRLKMPCSLRGLHRLIQDCLMNRYPIINESGSYKIDRLISVVQGMTVLKYSDIVRWDGVLAIAGYICSTKQYQKHIFELYNLNERIDTYEGLQLEFNEVAHRISRYECGETCHFSECMNYPEFIHLLKEVAAGLDEFETLKAIIEKH